MKINLDLAALEAAEFDLRMGKIGGDTVVLVNPHGFPKYPTRDWLVFRSSVWTMDGTLISAGFKKFFNLTEQPQLVPDPTDEDLKTAEVMEKLDGSLLIVSKYNGELIVRTRGTLDATVMEKNGFEIDELKQRYPKCFDNRYLDSENVSICYEWTSPLNKIVIPYGEVCDIKLVGVIEHEDYSYWLQDELDILAKELEVGRPRRFKFSSMSDIIALMVTLQGEEGYCVYYNDGQDIKKVKSDWYKARHRFKEDCSLEFILDAYVNAGEPSYVDFVEGLAKVYDHECLEQAIPFASKVCDASRQVKAILAGMNVFVQETLKPLPTRKEQALLVLSSYGKTNRAGYIFSLLDGKTLDKDAITKLYWQVLKG